MEEETIQSLFDRIIIQYISQIESETLTKIEVYISEKKDQIGDNIKMECLIIDVVKAFGNRLTFHIQSNLSYDDSSINAFNILMISSRTRYLPIFSFSNEPKSNDELKLEIISYIESHNSSWISEFIQSGKKFIRNLVEAFWYIDKCGFKTFNDKFTIPADFLQFVNQYDPMKNKKSRPKFTYDELNHYH
ncbi:hypothetical protein RclHR1_04730006 [Rhizophagus clarus]|nr:hypothetical protein RclHR1_04730006 [Rhizophagus clarus]